MTSNISAAKSGFRSFKNLKLSLISLISKALTPGNTSNSNSLMRNHTPASLYNEQNRIKMSLHKKNKTIESSHSLNLFEKTTNFSNFCEIMP